MVAISAACKAISTDAVIAIDRITGGANFAYFMARISGAIALMDVGNEARGAVLKQPRPPLDCNIRNGPGGFQISQGMIGYCVKK